MSARDERPGQALKDAVQRRGSFAQTVQAVAWSFFGVRRSKDYEQDVSRINPLHVVVAGVIGAVLFVGGLVLLVKVILGTGVAA